MTLLWRNETKKLWYMNSITIWDEYGKKRQMITKQNEPLQSNGK